MKSIVTGSLLFSVLFCSCSTGRSSEEEQIEKIASAVKSSPVFAKSDLLNFQKLDTLFITANELPKYRRLLNDMDRCGTLLKDAERIRDGKQPRRTGAIEYSKDNIDLYIETVRSDIESKKDALTNLIDNATDTIYRIECIESIKNSSNVMQQTSAIVYVNSHFKVIDYDH